MTKIKEKIAKLIALRVQLAALAFAVFAAGGAWAADAPTITVNGTTVTINNETATSYSGNSLTISSTWQQKGFWIPTGTDLTAGKVVKVTSIAFAVPSTGNFADKIGIAGCTSAQAVRTAGGFTTANADKVLFSFVDSECYLPAGSSSQIWFLDSTGAKVSTSFSCSFQCGANANQYIDGLVWSGAAPVIEVVGEIMTGSSITGAQTAIGNTGTDPLYACGVTGWLDTSGNKTGPVVLIENNSGAYSIGVDNANSVNSSGQHSTWSKLSGSGALGTVANNKGGTYPVLEIYDSSEFTGTISTSGVSGAPNLSVVFCNSTESATLASSYYSWFYSSGSYVSSIYVSAGRTTANNAVVTVPSGKTWKASMLVNAGETVVNGTFTGDVVNSGTLTVNGTVTGEISNSGTLTVNGTVTGEISNSGTLTVNGTVTGEISNSGTLIVNGTVSGKIINNGGTVTVNSSANFGTTRDLTGVTTGANGNVIVAQSSEEYGRGLATTISNIDASIASVTVSKRDGTSEVVAVSEGVATLAGTGNIVINGGATAYDVDFSNTSSPMVYRDRTTVSVRNVSTNSVDWYNYSAADKTTGLKVYNTPWIGGSSSNIEGFDTLQTNMTLAVVGQMPNVEDNAIFIHLGGSSGSNKGFLIYRLAEANKVAVAWNAGGGAIHNLTTMSVPHAADARHAYIITKVDDVTNDKTTFTIYLDGIKWQTAEVTPVLSISGGVQVGSDFQANIRDDDQEDGTRIKRVQSSNDSSAADTCVDTEGYVNLIRIYDRVLTQAEIDQFSVAEEYPYVSPDGNSARTLTEATEDWIQSSGTDWENTAKGAASATEAGSPLTGAALDVNASVESTVTVNLASDTSYEALTIRGEKTTFVNGANGKKVNVTGVTTISAETVIEAGAVDISGAPVMIVGDGSIKFDFTNYDFAGFAASGVITLTGSIDQNDAKVSVTLPAAYANRFVLQYNTTAKKYELAAQGAATLYVTAVDATMTLGGTAASGSMFATTAEGEASTGFLVGDTIDLNGKSGLTFTDVAGGAFTVASASAVDGNLTFDLNGGTVTLNVTEVDGDLTVTGYGDVIAGALSVSGRLQFTPDTATSNIVSAHAGYTLKLTATSVSAATLSGGATITTTGGVTAQTGTFYGTITGAGGLVKAGSGGNTLTLKGLGTYSGGLTINNGKVALANYLTDSLIYYNFDSSNTNAWTLTTDENGVVSVDTMKGSKGYAFDAHGDNDVKIVITNDVAYFGGKPVMWLSEGCRYYYGDGGSSSTYRNIRAHAMFYVYQQNEAMNGRQTIMRSNSSDYIRFAQNKVNTWFPANRWYVMRSSSAPDTDWPLFVDGTHNPATFTRGNSSVLSVITQIPTGTNRSDHFGSNSETFKGAVAEVLGVNTSLTLEGRNAIEAYLLNKWDCSNKASFSFIPAVPVTIASGAELDLGGFSQTVSSLNIAGTLSNGSLTVSGSVTANNATLTDATVTLADGATITVSSGTFVATPAGEYTLGTDTQVDASYTSVDGSVRFCKAAASVTTGGVTSYYSSVSAAFAPLTGQVTDETITLTILDDTVLDPSTITQLAGYDYYYNSTAGTITKAVAKIGTTTYGSLAAAVTDATASEAATVEISLKRASSEAVTLDAKTTVTEAAAGLYTGTLSGSGTLVLAGKRSAQMSFGEWTGKVSVPALTESEAVNLNFYGKSGSTVCLAGGFSGGWLANVAVAPAIEIPENQTITLSAFSPSFANSFAALKGAGAFVITAVANNDNDLANAANWGAGYEGYSAYFRLGDVSGFTGALTTSSDVGIALGDIKPAHNTVGGKIYVYTPVTASANWTAPSGIVIADAAATLTVGSGATITTDPAVSTSLTGYYVVENNSVYSVSNLYTITFVDEDGKTVLKAATEYAYGTAAADIEKPADPTKAATAQYTYTFNGWDPEVVAVTGDATYTATYSSTVNEYTIMWKNDDGSTIDTTQVAYGTIPTYADPSKQYYTFTGWDPSPVAVDGEATYTATFSRDMVTVTIPSVTGAMLMSATSDGGAVTPTGANTLSVPAGSTLTLTWQAMGAYVLAKTTTTANVGTESVTLSGDAVASPAPAVAQDSDGTYYADVMTGLYWLVTPANLESGYLQLLGETTGDNVYGAYDIGYDAASKRYAKAVALIDLEGTDDPGYLTVQAALDAAENGALVRIKANNSEALTLANGKSVTINAKKGDVIYDYTAPVAAGNYTVDAGETVEGVTTYTARDWYTWTVTVTAENATVTGVEDGDTVSESDPTITFTVTPDQYYSVSSVTANGDTLPPVDDEYHYTLEGDVTISATATRDQVTLTIPVVEHASAVVTVDGVAQDAAASYTINQGANVVVTWTAATTWKITADATQTLNPITTSQTATAPTVVRDVVTVTVPAVTGATVAVEASAGDVTDNGNGTYTVQAGATVTVTYTADEGKFISGTTGTTVQYQQTVDGDYAFEVTATTSDTVAKIGNTPYDSLASAISAAQSGDTVTLVANETADRVQISKSITLDLGGKTLTARVTVWTGTVTVQNGTIAGRFDAYDDSVVTLASTATINGRVVVWGDGTYGQAGCKTPTLNINGTIVTTGEYDAIFTSSDDASHPVVNINAGSTVTAETMAVRMSAPGGVLTMNGGEIDSDKWGVFVTGGSTFTMNGGSIEFGEGGFGVGNHGNDTAANGTDTVITIAGGTISGPDTAVYHPGEGTLDITGGTITGTTGVEVRSGTLNIPSTSTAVITATGAFDESANGSGATVTGAAVAISQHTTNNPIAANIQGGTFRSTGNAGVAFYVTDTVNADPTEVTATVSGGTFYAPVVVAESASDVEGFVSGGEFTSAVPEAVCADGYIPQDNGDGTYGVKTGAYVARNTTTGAGYESLAAAVEAAQANDTVALLADVAAERTTISKSLTLDLGGKTLTGRVTIDNGTVTVQNGTIAGRFDTYDSATVTLAATATVNGQAVVWGTGTYGESGCLTPTLNVYGTITNTDDAAISCNGTDMSGAIINIYDGAVVTSTDDVAIFLPSGNLTVSGGTITGTTGIYAKSGSVTVTGGTITGNGAAADYVYRGDGATATGDAIVIDNAGYPGGTPAAELTGGTFVSVNGKSVASYVATDSEAYTGSGTFERVDDFIPATSTARFSDAAADGVAAGYTLVAVENTDPVVYEVAALAGIQYFNTWSVANVFYFNDEDPIPSRTTQATVPKIKRTGESAYHAVEDWVTITWTVTASDATDASAAASTIATVDANGLVTFTAPGTVKVWLTMTDPSGATKSASKTVKYASAPAYVVSADGQTKTAYATLYAAFNHAETGEKIVLGADAAVSNIARMTLNDGRALTLDLNGHNITCSVNFSGTGSIFNIQSGSLSVVDTGTTKGGIAATGTGGRVFSMETVDNATTALTIGEGVNVSSAHEVCVYLQGNATLNTAGNLTAASDFAICGNGSAGNGGTTVNVTGGTVTGDEIAIYQPQDGALNISGGTITGGTAVYVKAGEVNITGGTLAATGSAADYAYNGSGANATGDALVIDNCGYPGGEPEVSITGGTFTSQNGKAVASYAKDENYDAVSGFVSGGSFSSAVAEDYCAEGFIPEDNGDGTYGVKEGVYVAEVEGGAKYESLADAIANCPANGTVKVISAGDPEDPSEYRMAIDSTIIIDKSMTLDLNGFFLIAEDCRVFWIKSGDVTITSSADVSAVAVMALSYEEEEPYAVIYPANFAESSSVIRVGDAAANSTPAKLTLDGMVNVEADYCYGVTVFGKNDDGVDGADIELVVTNGATVATTGNMPAISGNGTNSLKPTAITIAEGGVVDATYAYAIYHPGKGALVVNGTVTGDGGIEIKAGTLTIGEGAEVEATAEEQSHALSNNGTSTSGYAIAAVGNPAYVGDPAVEITGGTITGTIIALSDTGSEEVGATIAVSGGEFSEEVPAAYCAAGYEPAELEGGKYGVQTAKVVVEIDVTPTTTEPVTVLVAVPKACTAATLIDTTKRSAGDILKVYDKTDKCFYTWELASPNGTWTPLKTFKVDGSGTTTSEKIASEVNIAAGQSVWVTVTTDEDIMLLVSYNAEPIEVSVDKGWNLVAPTTPGGTTVNEIIESLGETIAQSDAIVVPSVNNGAPKIYNYVNGAWGYDDVEYETRTIHGQEVKVAKPVRKTADTEIPAGTGVWFVNGGTSPKEINL